MDTETSGLRDYLSILRRRKGILLLTFFGLLIISILAALLWPPTYRSSATILIREQEIPRDLVASTITSFADQRLQEIQARVMTTTNLSQLIEDFDLYPRDRDRLPATELVMRMRNDYRLDLQSADVIDPRTGRPTQATILFTISFEYGAPAIAQQVTNRLVTLYLNENLRDRTERAAETTSFLSEQANNINREMTILENALANFKQQNEGSLPELYQVNLQMMQRAESDMLEVQRQLQSINERRIYLQAELAQIPRTTPLYTQTGAVLPPAEQLIALRSEYARASASYGPNHPDVVSLRRQIDSMDAGPGSGQDLAVVETQLREVRAELSAQKERYGADHPDVLRLERQLEQLIAAKESTGAATGNVGRVTPRQADLVNVRTGPGKEFTITGTFSRGETAEVLSTDNGWYRVRLDSGGEGWVSGRVVGGTDNENAVASGLPVNPAYIQLQAQLAAAESEARSLAVKHEALAQKMAGYEARMVATPQVERQYTALTRDIENARIKYQEITSKKLAAEVAENLEQGRKGERFEVVEPALLPTNPHSPNRLALLFLGLVLSVAGSVGTTAISESMDSSVHDARSLASIIGASPLGIIPFISTGVDQKRDRRKLWFVLAGLAGAGLLALVLMHFLYRPLDILWFTLLRKLGI